MYYRSLADLETSDFAAACEHVIRSDQWFPTIARLRAAADECRTSRLRSERALASQTTSADLVCSLCHGARWRRRSGFDDIHVLASDPASRLVPCLGCTTNGVYDEAREAETIAQRGGVPNPNATRSLDDVVLTQLAPRNDDGTITYSALTVVRNEESAP